MSTFQALKIPNLAAEEQAGSCLGMQMKVWNAPGLYNSAWEAWEATQFKHTDRFPDVPCLVWFSHYGSYGEPGQEVYKNWGHVVSWVPGRGFLSSPGEGFGQTWLLTLPEVEKYFNSQYVGWSEDINTVRVLQWVSNSEVDGVETLRVVKYKGADFLIGSQFLSISPNAVVTSLITGLYGGSMDLGDDNAQMTRVCRIHGIPDGIFDYLYNHNRADLGFAWSAERGLYKPEEN